MDPDLQLLMKPLPGRVDLGLRRQQICPHQPAEVEPEIWVGVSREGKETAAESPPYLVAAAMEAGHLLVFVMVVVLGEALFGWMM